MTDLKDKEEVAVDLLKRLGSKWAVLTAMSATMRKKGIDVPLEASEKLKTTGIEIVSGCFSPCEVNCSLAEAESRIFSKCHLLEDQEFMLWSDLLGEAMQGQLGYHRIVGIPALSPVKNDCKFLACNCS